MCRLNAELAGRIDSQRDKVDELEGELAFVTHQSGTTQEMLSKNEKAFAELHDKLQHQSGLIMGKAQTFGELMERVSGAEKVLKYLQENMGVKADDVKVLVKLATAEKLALQEGLQARKLKEQEKEAPVIQLSPQDRQRLARAKRLKKMREMQDRRGQAAQNITPVDHESTSSGLDQAPAALSISSTLTDEQTHTPSEHALPKAIAPSPLGAAPSHPLAVLEVSDAPTADDIHQQASAFVGKPLEDLPPAKPLKEGQDLASLSPRFKAQYGLGLPVLLPIAEDAQEGAADFGRSLTAAQAERLEAVATSPRVNLQALSDEDDTEPASAALPMRNGNGVMHKRTLSQ